MPKYIKREKIKDKRIQKIFKAEKHHNHRIVKDHRGELCWEEKPRINELLDQGPGLNYLLPILTSLGYDKNSEVYRKLYRDMGYPLEGYWELFYWEVNNEAAKKYKSPKANI